MSYDQLTNDGYWIQPSAQCSADDLLLDQWAFTNLTVGMTIEPELAGSLNSPSDVLTARYGESVNIFRIPDGTTNVTAGMLTGAGSNLILSVPDSVAAIDTEILSDRILTLVGNTGSFAEQFARDNNLKFIVRVNTWLGQ